MARELFRLPRPQKKDIREVPKTNVDEIARYKAAGYVHRGGRAGIARLVKDREAWDIFEHEILIFFKDGLRLDDVDGGPLCMYGGHQVDACGGLSGTFVVADAKHTGDPKYTSVRRMVDDLARKMVAIRRDVLAQLGTKYLAISFAVVTNAAATPEDIKYALDHGVFLVDGRYYDICKSLYRTIGPVARFQIVRDLLKSLDEHEIPGQWTGDKVGRITLPALRTELPKSVTVFSFFMRAHDLLELAYVSRLETRSPGAYQRLLKKDKLNQIAEFLADGGYFKNNIIVGLDYRPYFRRTSDAKQHLYEALPGYVTLKRIPASLWVVDGQHRLFGFTRGSDQARQTAVPVIAILDSGDTSDQARTFVDINKNQTPISPDVLWALYSEVQPDSDEGAISLIVRRLAQTGVFKDNIFVPDFSPRPRSSYNIYMNNLCSGILDRKLLAPKNPCSLAQLKGGTPSFDAICVSAVNIINDFFTLAVSAANKADKRWVDGFILTNNGANILMRVLAETLRLFAGNYPKQRVRQLLNQPLIAFFRKNAAKVDDLRLGSSSEAGRSRVAIDIIAEIHKTNTAFGAALLEEHKKSIRVSHPYVVLEELEEKLRRFIEKTLKSVAGAKWVDELPRDVKALAEDRMKKNQNLWPWGRRRYPKLLDFVDFNDYAKIINSKWLLFQKAFKAKEMILGKLQELDPIRKDIAHPRKLERREEERLELYALDIKQAIREASRKRLSKAGAA